MYLKNIVINNIGPIDNLSVELPFNEIGDPKPIVFVGENGSGKTILQSQIIDGLYEIGSSLFYDIGVHLGLNREFYKISGVTNLQSGKDKGFSLLKFIDNDSEIVEYFDKVGDVYKEDFINFINDFTLSPNNLKGFQKETTIIENNRKEKLQSEWIQGVYIYQPAYRYEEPFWKNDHIVDYSRFEDQRRFSGKLGKELEIISSTKDNKSFLMNLVLDFANNNENVIDKNTWLNINKILQKIKKKEDIRFGIGPRGGYRVAIVKQDFEGNAIQNLLPSIDNLSLGESILLNLFVNIIRHGDNPPKASEQIQGIVAIDEIDVHLHTDLQNSVLPDLIKIFPKIQFIITTHSPLFLLGMKKTFGEDGFEVRNMPKGKQITTERFSEFERAYDILKETEIFEDYVKKQIENSTKPILFVEGDYDTRYIKNAGTLLGKDAVLEKIEILNEGGYSNLDKIWTFLKDKKNFSEIVSRKIILLYDCDTNKENKDNMPANVFKRVIPEIKINKIKKGIENLFDKPILDRSLQYKKAFIDITSETNQILRGQKKVVPEKWEINPDEKGNFCDWICSNGDKEDFKNFEQIFNIIEEIIKTDLVNA